LLLQDAVERGEMKLDDPVTKYLPTSIKMPTHGGKEITLLDPATHAAGFPADPDNMTGATMKEQYETCTVEKMYAFLSGYTLSRNPGIHAAFPACQVSVSLDAPLWIGWTGEHITRPGRNSSAWPAAPAVIMRGLASTRSKAGVWWC